MTRTVKTFIIIFAVIAIIVIGGLYFLSSFFGAFAPPKLKITTEYISTNRDFINGVTIARFEVDSLGKQGYPSKYTVTYLASCAIDHPKNRPPEPPSKIYFAKEGKYWWTEENVRIAFIHKGLSNQVTDSVNRIFFSLGDKRFKTCPLKFERKQWYLIEIGDPRISAIYFYIDEDGKEHQYIAESGVSPI